MHKFSDFADPDDAKPLDGKKVKINDILDIPIAIKNFRIRTSKYNKDGCGRYAMIQFNKVEDVNKANYFMTTGSEVLINLLEKYGDKVPFETSIVKIGEYFTFS